MATRWARAAASINPYPAWPKANQSENFNIKGPQTFATGTSVSMLSQDFPKEP
jgi:hypothetical protein